MLPTARVVDGQSLIMRTPAIERVWLTPDDVAASDGRPRARSPRPTSSSSARAACTRACCRACCCPASATRSWPRRRPALRLQRRDPGGRDRRASTSPPTSRRSSRTRRPGIVDVVLANNRFDAAGADGWHAEPSACAGRRPASPAPRLVLDDVVDPDNAHHHDPARLAAAVLRRLERETGVAAAGRSAGRA